MIRPDQLRQNGGLPIPADRDGDRGADRVLFRPSTNTWYTRFASGTYATTAFGAEGDKPLVGDFDVDGKADTALYKPSESDWYILKTGFGFFVQTSSEAGDIAVRADYDGDGKTDVAVFRPSTGQWFRIRSMAGFDTVNSGEMAIGQYQLITTAMARRMWRFSDRQLITGILSDRRQDFGFQSTVSRATFPPKPLLYIRPLQLFNLNSDELRVRNRERHCLGDEVK